MHDPTRRSSYIFASALLSVLLHLLILGFADRLRFEVVTGIADQSQRSKNLRVQTVDVRSVFEPRRPEQVKDQTTKEVAGSVRNHDLKIKGLFEKENLIAPPRPQLRLAGPGSRVDVPKTPTVPPREANAPRPSIIEIDAATLPESRMAIARRFTPKLPRQDVAGRNVPSLVAGGDLQAGLGSTLEVGMRLGGLTIPGLRLGDLPAGSIADTGADVGEQKKGGFIARVVAPDLPGLGRAARNGTEHYQELDQLLTVSMVVHENRDGSGLFRIDISPNPRSERLPAVPKDVLFLIDCSNSISVPKLEHFREGVMGALEYLNRQDRFNVVSFRDRPVTFFPDYAPVNAETLKQAKDYVTALVRDGMTDVYASLEPFVGTDRDPQRPLNIFLLTDGKSTVKNSLDNETMIRQVVAINRANVSIYTFSAGRSANLFLLDLLAYNNRGTSLHRDKLPDLSTDLVRFISTHADLIVADLQYSLTADLTAGIYPKSLPHLYRGETLSLFGSYPAGTQEIAASLVGRDGRGQLQEMIYRGNLRTAPRADAQLASDWACQKVLHLISQNTLHASPEMQAEIRNIAKKYGLYIPYL